MDLRKLMKEAEKMQQQLQRQIEQLSVAASVGGGMVRVTMNGSKQLTAVAIEPDVLDPSDPAMLQDLVQAAVNEAGRLVDAEIQARVGAAAPGLAGLPRA